MANSTILVSPAKVKDFLTSSSFFLMEIAPKTPMTYAIPIRVIGKHAPGSLVRNPQHSEHKVVTEPGCK